MNDSEICFLYTSILVLRNAIVKRIAKVKPPYGNRSSAKNPTISKNISLNTQLLNNLIRKLRKPVPEL